KPRKGESQSDFMSRCMHETFSADAPESRTQEQAVAICFGYWRDEHGGKPPSKNADEIQRIIRVWCALLSKYTDESLPDIPVPENDEDRDDFIERCVDELEASAPNVDESDIEFACQTQWEDQGPGGYGDVMEESANGIMHKAHAETVHGMEF